MLVMNEASSVEQSPTVLHAVMHPGGANFSQAAAISDETFDVDEVPLPLPLPLEDELVPFESPQGRTQADVSDPRSEAHTSKDHFMSGAVARTVPSRKRRVFPCATS